MKNLSKIRFKSFLLLCFLVTSLSFGQTYTSFQDISDNIKSNYLIQDSSSLISNRAFNIFFQKKLSNYLSGSSDLSLYKFFAIYGSEKDKMNFGLNFAFPKDDNDRVSLIFSPSIELGIKDNFATLRDKGKWTNDIRLGGKITYITSRKYINYFDSVNKPYSRMNQKGKMLSKRAKIYVDIKRKIEKDDENQFEDLKIGVREFGLNETSDSLIIMRDTIPVKTDIQLDTALAIDFKKKYEEYAKEFANAEVDYLKDRHTYAFSFSHWISVWGFVPVTDQKIYSTSVVTTPFKLHNPVPWEINAQFSILWEGNLGVVLGAFGLKYYQNNTAMAKIMEFVDYDKFMQYAGANSLVFAETAGSKAYIGDYKKFNTGNANLQIVYMLPLRGSINFGLSGTIEQNVGNYNARNIKIGFPFTITGKEKPINIEIQLIMNNTNNYEKKTDYRQNHTIGLNIGLPFASLFK